MFPQPQDQKGYKYPKDGLLQAFDFIWDDEMCNPQQLNVHGEKCLLVMKNGLKSFMCIYKEYNITQKSLEIAVLSYNKAHSKFSEAGDSGLVVLNRVGCSIRIITGGSLAGPTNETNTTYLTPYWWLKEWVKAKFPGCFLYEVIP
ncbi:hypothetical protein FRC11_010641 [Ceratobasidium sp. 423]|nr:hypothetical protein FRC11_010641 [Ceratobasidium sp. 423]